MKSYDPGNRLQGHRVEGRIGLDQQGGQGISSGGQEENDIRNCRNGLTVELADRLLLSFLLSSSAKRGRA